jgi:outer membrane receptor protein involved in Fe transport
VEDYKERFADNDVLCAAGDPGCIADPEVPKYLYYPSYTRHDLSVNYDMALQSGTNLNIFGGVRNMFNKDPFVPRTGDAYEGGIGNYDSKFGGGIGRFYFVGAEMRFGG